MNRITRSKRKHLSNQSAEDQGLLEAKFINSYKGYGVFAKTDLNPGDFICHYKGELIEGAEGDRRLRDSDGPGSFLFFFKKDGKTWCIDGTKSSGMGRLINDSRKANCKVKKMNDILSIYAVHHIKAGEELTFDYGDPTAYWRKFHSVSGRKKFVKLQIFFKEKRKVDTKGSKSLTCLWLTPSKTQSTSIDTGLSDTTVKKSKEDGLNKSESAGVSCLSDTLSESDTQTDIRMIC